jgi:F-type H+-transporting ATPase subunit b
MFVTPAFAAEEQTGTTAEGHAAPAAGDAHGAAAGTHAGTEAAGGHGGVFPPFDTSTFPSQLLWLAITFGLFYLFLKKAVLPRIGGILEVRRDRIAEDLDQAAQLKDQAEQAHAAYEQELAAARQQAGAIGQKARDDAKAEADAERDRLGAELDGKLAAAEKRIADIKAKAMKEVGGIAETTAGQIVRELLGGPAPSADIASAIKSIRG